MDELTYAYWDGQNVLSAWKALSSKRRRNHTVAMAVIEKQADVLNVQPEGRMDTVRTPLLDRELQPHLDGIREIVMDFSRVEYISSSGLRLLLWLEQTLEDRGGELRLIHANEAVMKIIRLAGFDNVVRVIEDEGA